MQWKSVVPVAVVSAVIGCLAAVGIVAGFDLGGGHTTTVVQQAPLRGQDASGGSEGGLTPRDIYKRAGPGVVFIRAQVVEQTQSPFDFGFPQQQRGEATGSGFVTDRDGQEGLPPHDPECVTSASSDAKPILRILKRRRRAQ